MSFRIFDLVWAKRLPSSITKRRPETRLALLALARYSDDAGESAWPSVGTLAVHSEVSEKIVRAAEGLLAALRDAGLIAEQAPPGQHRPRTWRLVLPAIEALDDARPVDSERQDDAGLKSSDENSERHDAAGLRDSERHHAAGLKESAARHDAAGLEASGRQIRHSGRHDAADDPTVESTKSSSEREDAAAEVLRLFSSAFERKVGEPRPDFAKDERVKAAQLVSAHPLARIKKTIPAFFDGSADRNGYYESQQFPFRMFLKQFDKIAAVSDRAAADAAQRERTPYMNVDATTEYLRRMKGINNTPMPAGGKA